MKSFIHAFRGIAHAVKHERNMRFHLAAVFYIVIAGLYIHFDPVEWALVALACGLVLGAELLNTALERLCDGLEPGRSSVVKTVKDLASGAVLACAAAAACIAVFLFWPNISLLLAWNALTLECWIAIAALPFWVWFVFWFGRKKSA
jgi:diacylglycerol kinase